MLRRYLISHVLRTDRPIVDVRPMRLSVTLGYSSTVETTHKWET